MKPTEKAPSGASKRRDLLARADKALAKAERKHGPAPRLPADQHEAFLRNHRRTRSR
jgi:predicted signal transduction protein with EAL and GGDEF domain